MIAQLLLSVLLAGVLLYAWTAYRQSPVVGLLATLSAFAGWYFVWFPSHATALAAWIGIGRGVDLILYTWVGISLILLLNLHLHLRAQMELITLLARAVAIANAKGPSEGTPPLQRGEESCNFSAPSPLKERA